MIDVRYHVLSLAAVLLALAVGVTLGAGPLRSGVAELVDPDDLQAQVAVLEQELDTATDAVEQLDGSAAALAAAGSEQALAGRSVLVVTLPGTGTGDVADVTESLTGAGASVTATLTLTDAWTEPGQAPFRSALAAQVEPLLADTEVEPVTEGDTAQLAAALSLALVAGVEQQVDAGTAGTVLGVLSGGELAVLEPELPGPAELVLVVAGAQVDDETAAAWAPVLGALAVRGPVLLVDDAASATAAPEGADSDGADSDGADGDGADGDGADGDRIPHVVAVRTAAATAPTEPVALVSTLDHADTATGRVATVLALAAAAAGQRGDYGLLQSAEGAVPVSP